MSNVEKQSQPFWKTGLKWIPRIALLGALFFLFVIQDPCGCGLQNHYRLTWAGNTLEVELSPQARDLINPALLTYELEQEVQGRESLQDLEISFFLMPEFDTGFERTSFYQISYHGQEELSELAVETLSALDLYFNP